jgi:hypothetical protein
MSAKRTFTHTLTALERGLVVEDLDAKLRALVNQCRDTNKKGSIALVLTIDPGKGSAFVIDAEVKIKLPQHNRFGTLMFPTPEGHLQRNDPLQGELEGIRSVDAPPDQEVRKAS